MQSNIKKSYFWREIINNECKSLAEIFQQELIPKLIKQLNYHLKQKFRSYKFILDYDYNIIFTKTLSSSFPGDSTNLKMLSLNKDETTQTDTSNQEKLLKQEIYESPFLNPQSYTSLRKEMWKELKTVSLIDIFKYNSVLYLFNNKYRRRSTQN